MNTPTSSNTTTSVAQPKVQHDVTALAPKFGTQLLMGLHECWRQGYDPIVYEAIRSNELQEYYYEQGRTRPGSIITNASAALSSWHFYGLAVDIVSKTKEWSWNSAWITGVATILKQHGLDWGGDWSAKRQDPPHFQWGRLKPSPSDRARQLYASGGLPAVWAEVGAI